MGWLLLMFTILSEVAGTVFMKFSEGFTKIIPTICVFVFYLGSVAGLTYTIKYLPLSITYTVWAGVGTALIAIIGILCFKETFTVLKMVSIILIILGVIGLNIK